MRSQRSPQKVRIARAITLARAGFVVTLTERSTDAALALAGATAATLFMEALSTEFTRPADLFFRCRRRTHKRSDGAIRILALVLPPAATRPTSTPRIFDA